MPLISAATDLAHWFLLPPASLFLLLAIGLLLRLRWRRFGTAIAGATLAVFFVLSSQAGAHLLVQPLENRTAVLRPVDMAGAQAIVVLAAGRIRQAPEYDNLDIPDYIGLARLRFAAHLQQKTGLPILVSGGSGEADGAAEAQADAMARALREDFRTPVRWLERRSLNTAQNALFSARILQPQGVQRILLVTDAMHMARAEQAFRQSGFAVVAAPTMFFGGGSLSLRQFLPSAEGLRQSYYAMYEWIGLEWYRVRGGPI